MTRKRFGAATYARAVADRTCRRPGLCLGSVSHARGCALDALHIGGRIPGKVLQGRRQRLRGAEAVAHALQVRRGPREVEARVRGLPWPCTHELRRPHGGRQLQIARLEAREALGEQPADLALVEARRDGAEEGVCRDRPLRWRLLQRVWLHQRALHRLVRRALALLRALRAALLRALGCRRRKGHDAMHTH